MQKELKIYMPGELLFEEGDPSGGLYFIQSGKVDIYRVREETEISLGILGPGEILGTLTVLSGEPRTASARATTRVEVQYMSSTSLQKGMDKIPVWAVAIIKDTIARLKHVDELLVQSSLKEKKLRQEAGNVFNQGAQLASFCALLMRHGTREEDGVKVWPAKGISAQAESILNLRAESIDSLWEAFVRGGLAKTFEDKKWGIVIRDPRPKVWEDFAVFANKVAKKGTGDFIPQKLSRWAGTLVRVRRKFEGDSVDVDDFLKILEKDSGRAVPNEMIEVFKDRNLLRMKEGKISYEAETLQKRIVFEGTCLALVEINAEFTADQNAA